MKINITFIFLLLFAHMDIACASDQASLQQAEAFPLTIDSRDGMKCDRQQQSCSAEGQVVVRKGPYEMFAHKAKAFMRKNDLGKNEIHRIEVYDDIRFFGVDGETGASDTAIYDLDEKLLKLSSAKGKQAIFWRDEYILKADELEIHLREDDTGKLSIHQIVALNDVILSSPEEIVEGDNAVFTPDDSIVIVTGDVRVTKKEGQLRGNYAKVNVDTKQSEVLKRPDMVKDERVRVFVYPENTKNSSIGSKIKSDQK